jgi:hypothetical protein
LTLKCVTEAASRASINLKLFARKESRLWNFRPSHLFNETSRFILDEKYLEGRAEK